MRIGIDASNIGGGGGITHLRELLDNFDHDFFSEIIDKIVVFASHKVLDQLDDECFIQKVSFPELNNGLLSRIRFQLKGYDNEIQARCDLLFSITGDYLGSFRPLVGMSRNMLLYERNIWWEIKQPKEILRFWLNYRKQKQCFNNCDGIIFISNFAKQYVSSALNLNEKNISTIHHGISPRFEGQIKEQQPLDNYSFENPFRFLYVSTIHTYKNQSNVVKAIAALRKDGYPIELNLVGGVIFEPSGKELEKTISEVDPMKEYIFWKGHIEYSEIQNEYINADGIIYASTCENMPNILIESMASGKAIACSNKQPMPEFLKDGGFYFDAKDSKSIADTLIKFLEAPLEREICIRKNKIELNKYSWQKTSRETFSFLLKNYNQYQNV